MIKLLKKIWHKLWHKEDNCFRVMPMENFRGNLPLSEEEVLVEVENWIKKIGETNYQIYKGVLFTKNDKLPNGMAIHYNYSDKLGKLHVYPDSFRISHSTMKSLKGTLGILENENEEKPVITKE